MLLVSVAPQGVGASTPGVLQPVPGVLSKSVFSGQKTMPRPFLSVREKISLRRFLCLKPAENPGKPAIQIDLGSSVILEEGIFRNSWR